MIIKKNNPNYSWLKEFRIGRKFKYSGMNYIYTIKRLIINWELINDSCYLISTTTSNRDLILTNQNFTKYHFID